MSRNARAGNKGKVDVERLERRRATAIEANQRRAKQNKKSGCSIGLMQFVCKSLYTYSLYGIGMEIYKPRFRTQRTVLSQNNQSGIPHHKRKQKFHVMAPFLN